MVGLYPNVCRLFNGSSPNNNTKKKMIKKSEEISKRLELETQRLIHLIQTEVLMNDSKPIILSDELCFGSLMIRECITGVDLDGIMTAYGDKLPFTTELNIYILLHLLGELEKEREIRWMEAGNKVVVIKDNDIPLHQSRGFIMGFEGRKRRIKLTQVKKPDTCDGVYKQGDEVLLYKRQMEEMGIGEISH